MILKRVMARGTAMTRGNVSCVIFHWAKWAHHLHLALIKLYMRGSYLLLLQFRHIYCRDRWLCFDLSAFARAWQLLQDSSLIHSMALLCASNISQLLGSLIFTVDFLAILDVACLLDLAFRLRYIFRVLRIAIQAYCAILLIRNLLLYGAPRGR